MKKPFMLTLNIEHSRQNNTAEILETVELGEFKSEAEAREILETILDAAGFEEEEEVED